MTYYVDRHLMFADLPKGTIGAEIGVQTGAFSSDISRMCSPKMLHLVDCWEHQDDPSYANDPANIPQAGQDELYRTVKRMADYHGNMKVHRDYSLHAAEYIKGLDWVYLDANHSYGEVLDDLHAWSKCLKDDGIIMGHDFVDNGRSRKMGFGVVDAIKDFCRQCNWQIDALTLEEWSSYKLVKL